MRLLALITGGTSGIGLGIARALAPSHNLALVYASNEARAHEAQAQLKNVEPECQVRVFARELKGEPDCISLLDDVTEQFQCDVAVLINSAGKLRDGLFMAQEFGAHEAMVQEHLLVPMALSRLCLQKMYRQKFGRIVNISSITARRAKRGQVNYTTVKAAIEGFTKGLALEVAHRGVTVNAIAPGLIETPMTQELIQSLKEAGGSLRAVIPMGRAGRTDEIGALVAFLASEKGQYITGQTIDIDGGRGLGENA